MIDRLQTVFHTTVHGVQLVFSDATSVLWGWMVVGAILHVVANAVRQKGWYTILRAAYPDADELRLRDVEAAYFAGSGVNAIIPARGGDVLKVFLLHRRIGNANYSTIAATFLPETLFETAFGFGLVIWALAQGFLPVPVSRSDIPAFDVSFVIAHPFITAAGIGVASAGVWMLVRWVRRKGLPLLERMRAGLAIFSSPRQYLLGVVTWQALGRLIRLGSLAAFMAAFSLPVTFKTAVLVMAAQGGGRIIPIAPVSAGLRLTMLSYGFVEVTGKTVDIASITAFTVGVSVVLLVVGLAIAMVILFKVLGTLNPRHAIRAARAALAARRAGPDPAAAS
jgi:hypothetical protein